MPSTWYVDISIPAGSGSDGTSWGNKADWTFIADGNIGNGDTIRIGQTYAWGANVDCRCSLSRTGLIWEKYASSPYDPKMSSWIDVEQYTHWTDTGAGGGAPWVGIAWTAFGAAWTRPCNLAGGEPNYAVADIVRGSRRGKALVKATGANNTAKIVYVTNNPGSWHYDSTGFQFYYRPYAGDPAPNTVLDIGHIRVGYSANNTPCIALTGSQSVDISDLGFGLLMSHAIKVGSDGVVSENHGDIVVDGCSFSHTHAEAPSSKHAILVQFSHTNPATSGSVDSVSVTNCTYEGRLLRVLNNSGGNAGAEVIGSVTDTNNTGQGCYLTFGNDALVNGNFPHGDVASEYAAHAIIVGNATDYNGNGGVASTNHRLTGYVLNSVPHHVRGFDFAGASSPTGGKDAVRSAFTTIVDGFVYTNGVGCYFDSSGWYENCYLDIPNAEPFDTVCCDHGAGQNNSNPNVVHLENTQITGTISDNGSDDICVWQIGSLTNLPSHLVMVNSDLDGATGDAANANFGIVNVVTAASGYLTARASTFNREDAGRLISGCQAANIDVEQCMYGDAIDDANWSNDTSIDTKAEWTSTIDPNGEYDATITSTLDASGLFLEPTGDRLTTFLTTFPSLYATVGINGEVFSGMFGAWQDGTVRLVASSGRLPVLTGPRGRRSFARYR